MKTTLMKRLINRLFNLNKKTDNSKLASKIKSHFRLYFEGISDFEQIYETFINVSSFGITDIKFYFNTDEIIMHITLERPGLLIGKRGNTIDSVMDYLSKIMEKQVKIQITESKLWR